MFTATALRMGYKVVVYDPDPQSPAALIASQHICAEYTDSNALDELIECCDAVTIEFENIPIDSLSYVEAKVLLSPPSSAVAIAQNRMIEKTFFQDNNLKTADFYAVESVDDITKAVEVSGLPCIIKTAQFGYDGKGQAVCNTLDDVISAFNNMGCCACIVEKKINLAMEVSVIIACGQDGEITPFPIAENVHTNGILDTTVVPANISEIQAKQALDLAIALAVRLKYHGILAVELFVSEKGEILINEIAPRPHNSGHYTQDATDSCQFEQQVRMMCSLKAGGVFLQRDVVMLNILGDFWNNTEPDWKAVYQGDNTYLHLYAKNEARSGRKMGHINLLGSNRESLLSQANKLKVQLSQ